MTQFRQIVEREIETLTLGRHGVVFEDRRAFYYNQRRRQIYCPHGFVADWRFCFHNGAYTVYKCDECDGPCFADRSRQLRFVLALCPGRGVGMPWLVIDTMLAGVPRNPRDLRRVFEGCVGCFGSRLVAEFCVAQNNAAVITSTEWVAES